MPHFQKLKQKQGFTLIEILIVVAVITIITVTAIANYFNVVNTYSSLSDYEKVNAIISRARTYAINNSEFQGMVPPRYGIWMVTNKIIFFADNGEQSYFYDPGGSTIPDSDVEVIDFDDSGVIVEALDATSAHNPIGEPIVLFYENGGAEFTAMVGEPGTIIPKNTNQYIIFRVCDAPCNADDFRRYIVLFQVSGLPEKFDNLNATVL